MVSFLGGPVRVVAVYYEKGCKINITYVNKVRDEGCTEDRSRMPWLLRVIVIVTPCEKILDRDWFSALLFVM